MSPLRLALSGHVELVEELIRNRRWRDRLKLLLGPSSFRPPVRVDHLTRAGRGIEPA